MTRLTPPLMKCSLRDLVGELDARAAVGRAAGFELVERGEDRRLSDRQASTAAPGPLSPA